MVRPGPEGVNGPHARSQCNTNITDGPGGKALAQDLEMKHHKIPGNFVFSYAEAKMFLFHYRQTCGLA